MRDHGRGQGEGAPWLPIARNIARVLGVLSQRILDKDLNNSEPAWFG